MRTSCVTALVLFGLGSADLGAQAGQRVGQVLPVSSVVPYVTTFAGACRDNVGDYWTTYNTVSGVYLLRVYPSGASYSSYPTNISPAFVVADLAFDPVRDRIWVFVADQAPEVYDAITGAFVGTAGSAGVVWAGGKGITWNGSAIVVADTDAWWDPQTLASNVGTSPGTTAQGLLYSPTTGRYWGSRAGGDPNQVTGWEFTELPTGATMPPNLELVSYNGAWGGRPRGCEAWQDPVTNEWLGVFCQEGDNLSAVLYTCRLSEPTGPGCGGPDFQKGPAIVQDTVYAEGYPAVGPTWLFAALAPGALSLPGLGPGCMVHVDPLLAVPIGPLVPQGSVVSGAVSIPVSIGLEEMPLWFQMGTLTPQLSVVLSEGRSAAIKQGVIGGTSTITEHFITPGMLDTRVSSGTWSNGARPGPIGGDGRHGSFDYTLGTQLSPTWYRFDTTSVVIPWTSSLFGYQYDVTDGKFYFTDFEIPAGITVDFVGPVPPLIRVCGVADIQGSLRLNGAAMTNFNGRGGTISPAPFVPGQPGGVPGAGGGFGGKGGDECQGNGPIVQGGVVLTDGQDGEDVRLLAGHGYAAQAIGTGGRGSGMNPPTGIAAPNSPLVGFVYRAYFAPGGGGGGFSGPGGTASVTPITNLQLGPVPAGGAAFDIASLSSVGHASLDHYTIGGSGGGGGGTHAFGTIYVTGDVYIAGSGGSGGGGACALRAGGDLRVGSGANLEARGGAGVLIDGRAPYGSSANVNYGVSSPGGGGSGGSFLLQSGGDLTVAGTIDTGGGDGSTTGNVGTASINVNSSAGAGAPGFFRLEAAGAVSFSGTSTPPFVAATNSAGLTDFDAAVSQTSRWYGTHGASIVAWLHYELDVDTDGDGVVDIVYTDSGAPGTQAANDPNGPVMFRIQGAQLDPATGLPYPWLVSAWFGSASPLTSWAADAFRFVLTFRRDLHPLCVVRGLRVFLQR